MHSTGWGLVDTILKDFRSVTDCVNSNEVMIPSTNICITFLDCHKLGRDLPPLCFADINLVLSPGQSADQHYQELTPGRASGQWK